MTKDRAQLMALTFPDLLEAFADAVWDNYKEEADLAKEVLLERFDDVAATANPPGLPNDDGLLDDEQYFVRHATWWDYLLLHIGLVRYRVSLGMRNAARHDGVNRALHYSRSKRAV